MPYNPPLPHIIIKQEEQERISDALAGVLQYSRVEALESFLLVDLGKSIDDAFVFAGMGSVGFSAQGALDLEAGDDEVEGVNAQVGDCGSC